MIVGTIIIYEDRICKVTGFKMDHNFCNVDTIYGYKKAAITLTIHIPSSIVTPLLFKNITHLKTKAEFITAYPEYFI